MQIEEYNRVENEPNTRYLRWSFGKSLQKTDLRFGYEMKVFQQPQKKETFLEWQYSGTLCKGTFFPSTQVCVMHFILRNSMVTVTYRIVDEDSTFFFSSCIDTDGVKPAMAICIVEIDDKQQPTIQYGNMHRIDPNAYSGINSANTL